MIKKGSYVITLIVMMTWSITYHSWLSFILLLSSCIIWMMPNNRQACLHSSPILVVYSLFLLLGQYVYSLNLTDQELPVEIMTVSISQIGFKKYGELSYQPLFVKVCYTFIFWITLRQYTEEDASLSMARRASALTPVPNISGDANTADQQLTYQSKTFDKLIVFGKQMLIKYWIWMVITMLMIMSLSGSRVVIYRIVYMFLFLSFTLLFQVFSWAIYNPIS